jgi:capsular exopolysaccharide synthesis family protein
MEYSEHHGPAEAEPPTDGGPATANLLLTLLRAKWLILGVFVLVSGVAIPLIWLKMAPEYKATALVRVSPVVSRIVFDTEERTLPFYASHLNTQVFMVLSSRVLQRVLDRKDVHQTSWYRGRSPSTSGDASPPSIAALVEALSVKRRKNTELIEVTMAAGNPEDAKVVADAVVDEYKRVSDETLKETNAHRLETLFKERVSLLREIKGLVERKHSLSKTRGPADAGDIGLLYSTRLFELEMEYDVRKRDAALAERKLQTLLNANKGSGDKSETAVEDTEQERRYAEDTEWRGLDRELERQRHELDMARQQYGEANPRIKQLKGDVDLLQRLRRQREQQLAAQWQAFAGQIKPASEGAAAFLDRATLERLGEELEHELQLRRDEIEGLYKRVTELGDLSIEEARLEEAIREKRELLVSVRDRYTELEIEGRAPARISTSYAIEPTGPSLDKRMKLSIATLGGAMMMGMVLAILLAKANPKVVRLDDVRVPFLGQLPPFSSETDLMAGCGPAVTEGIRMVRTALLELLAGTDRRVILITSPSGQSGKTSVAVLLAKSLASLGKKTLLVEGDLRRPSLSRHLNLISKAGLASVLTGDERDDQATISTGIAGPDVLMAGETPAEFNSDLLANGVFASCLKRWKKRYDFVLVDSPPVFPVADAHILAGQVDGTIMVVRRLHSRVADVAPACARLTAAGGTVLGAVLVDAGSGSGGLYYDEYEYQSYHGQAPALEAEA